MSTEENKAVVRRFSAAVLNQGDFSHVDEILAPDFVLHGFAGFPPNRAGVEMIVGAFRAAFPDWRETIEELIAEGDTVVARITGSGTHQHEFMGIPAKGTHVTVSAIAMYRIAGGMIQEDWVQIDQLGLLQQLGALPTPG
jgi:steroid delta-isomerase-like uncharacterized protein